MAEYEEPTQVEKDLIAPGDNLHLPVPLEKSLKKATYDELEGAAVMIKHIVDGYYKVKDRGGMPMFHENLIREYQERLNLIKMEMKERGGFSLGEEGNDLDIIVDSYMGDKQMIKAAGGISTIKLNANGRAAWPRDILIGGSKLYKIPILDHHFVEQFPGVPIATFPSSELAEEWAKAFGLIAEMEGWDVSVNITAHE